MHPKPKSTNREATGCKATTHVFAVLFTNLVLLTAPPSSLAAEIESIEPIGTMGKGVKVLGGGKEAVLFEHEGKGCLSHFWFGGAFDGEERTRIRYYVDGEVTPSIDMELYPGHGIGFNEKHYWGQPFRIDIPPPVSPQQTARIEKNHRPQHFLDLCPLRQGQGWLRTYFDICGKASGETFSPEEFNARKPRWKQWAADRRTN